MTRTIQGRHWIATLVVVAVSFLSIPRAAAAPFSFSFPNSTTPVYDLTGNYQLTQSAQLNGVPVTLVLDFDLAQNATGRLQGSGATTIQIGTNIFPATYKASGRISGGGKLTRATIVIRWQAGDGTGQANPSFSICVQYALQVSPAGLAGSARGTLQSAALGNGRVKSSISSVPLPAGIDGSWTVQMNVQSPAPLAGNAAVILPNGRNIQTTLTGTASSHSGMSRVKLSGVNSDRANTLSLSFFTGTSSVQNMKGRILGQSVSRSSAAGQFIGMQACLECHKPIAQTVINTRHAHVGVECENCHGPAGNHAANSYDPAARPIVDLGGAACGACHSGPQHPTFEEWSSSDHAQVVGDLNAPDKISSCGRCHSGSVRESLLDGVALPAGGANVPIGCAVCHEPHDLTGNPAQLRNPISSTNDYSITTNGVFATQYNPNVNLCGQCHNHRGAAWTNTSEPPHFSAQYNYMLGTIGELDSGLPHFQPASHALLITNQCVGCHMPAAPFQSDAQPARTGHKFTVDSFDSCMACHPLPDLLLQFVSLSVSNQIQTVKSELDLWATNNAPASLSAKYGTRAWEYTSPGELSPGGSGPTEAEQAQIPITIQKARFNLYLVLRDGSFGAHNGPYTITLLDTAQAWVEAELNN